MSNPRYSSMSVDMAALRRSWWLALMICQSLIAADIHASPAGDDAHRGSQTQPVASLARAQELAGPLAGKEVVTVHGLGGEEFSAFGVTKEAGGVAVMEVPADSVASRMGLLAGDLIQGLNGRGVSNLAEFLAALPPTKTDAPLHLQLVRDQPVKVIEIPPRPRE